MSVAWSSIERRLEANGGDRVYLLVKISDASKPPVDALADIRMATERANAALDKRGDELVWAEDPVPSPKGPIVHLDWIGTEEQNREWLEAFAGALSDAGRSGQITAAPIAHFPQELARSYTEQPRPTAFFAYRLDRTIPNKARHWYVADDVTLDIGRQFQDWGSIEGGTLYMREYEAQFIFDASAELAPMLCSAMSRSEVASATFLRKRPPIASRALTMSQGGEVTVQTGGIDQTWSDHAAALRQALLWHPAFLDIAVVRSHAGYGGRWINLDATWVGLPYIHEFELRHNRHLWGQYVPDAHGLQLLTEAHISKATDLDDWAVTKVAPERYLVEAHDLEPWYGVDRPSDAVLAKARQDFGAMILSPTAISEDPRGWRYGSPTPPAT